MSDNDNLLFDSASDERAVRAFMAALTDPLQVPDILSHGVLSCRQDYPYPFLHVVPFLLKSRKRPRTVAVSIWPAAPWEPALCKEYQTLPQTLLRYFEYLEKSIRFTQDLRQQSEAVCIARDRYLGTGDAERVEPYQAACAECEKTIEDFKSFLAAGIYGKWFWYEALIRLAISNLAAWLDWIDSPRHQIEDAASFLCWIGQYIDKTAFRVIEAISEDILEEVHKQKAPDDEDELWVKTDYLEENTNHWIEQIGLSGRRRLPGESYYNFEFIRPAEAAERLARMLVPKDKVPAKKKSLKVSIHKLCRTGKIRCLQDGDAIKKVHLSDLFNHYKREISKPRSEHRCSGIASHDDPSKMTMTLTLDDFVFDDGTEQVTVCPDGQQPIKSVHHPETGKTVTVMAESSCGQCRDCDVCPVKKSNGQYILVHTARQRQQVEKERENRQDVRD